MFEINGFKVTPFNVIIINKLNINNAQPYSTKKAFLVFSIL